MALTVEQQKTFSKIAAQWLADQHKAGNVKAEYQFYTASYAQVKTVLQNYADSLIALNQGLQTGAPTTRASEDATWQAEIDNVNAILAASGA